MADTIIEWDYHLTLPAEVRSHVSIGQRYEVSVSIDGNLVLSPVVRRPTPAEIEQILALTAGLWWDRDDIPDSRRGGLKPAAGTQNPAEAG